MKSSKPPAVASWLLEHLMLTDKKDAVIGDLSEQFWEGRSSRWYWRQALVAILVGFWTELRILWLAIAFTVAWILSLSFFYGRVWIAAQSQAILAVGIRRPWPESIIYAITCFTVLNALPIPMALAAYCGTTGHFSFGRFLRGLTVGMAMLAVTITLGLAFWPTSIHASLITRIVASIPIFLALLLSMCAARPRATRRKAAA